MDAIMGLLNMVTGGMCQPSQQGGVVMERTMEPRYRSPCPTSPRPFPLFHNSTRTMAPNTNHQDTTQGNLSRDPAPMTMMIFVSAPLITSEPDRNTLVFHRSESKPTIEAQQQAPAVSVDPSTFVGVGIIFESLHEG